MSLSDALRLYEQRRITEADEACLRALSQNPADAAAWHLAGRIALAQGRPEQAAERIGKAVSISPAVLSYRADLGAVLAMSGRPAEALPHLREALRMKPDAAQIHNNVGGALDALGQFSEALASYDAAIRLHPAYAEAHYNSGNTLRKMGRQVNSVAAYRQALRVQPDYFKALNNLATVLEDIAEGDEALASMRRVTELRPDLAAPHSSLLYSMHYHPRYGPEELYREHVEWARRHAEPLGKNVLPHQREDGSGRRLRVGYVSPDFREHTVPRFIGAALEHHDRTQVEVFLYSDAAQADETTAHLRGLGHAWRDTAKLSDEEVGRLVREQDRIDVLVDLRGHAANNRMTLFARKPAPVQATMVGYFDTTGLPTMDWRVTDAVMDPPGQTEQFHTERLARLPHSCWCYSADADAPEVAEAPVSTAGHLTFGSFNKIVKVSEPCARLWAAVLGAVPKSRLLLSVVGQDVAEHVRLRLARMGLPPDRLDLVPPTRGRREYLRRFARIDVMLDPFPFNGITTTCDGLWMGVPAVSLAGKTSVSRAGRSILGAAGLGELSTDSPDEYVSVAAGLAGDVQRLRELRRTMREQLRTSPLMDHVGFTRDLESAYRRMWEAWAAGGA